MAVQKGSNERIANATALLAMQTAVILTTDLSVCPSVRPSVRHEYNFIFNFQLLKGT